MDCGVGFVEYFSLVISIVQFQKILLDASFEAISTLVKHVTHRYTAFFKIVLRLPRPIPPEVVFQMVISINLVSKSTVKLLRHLVNY